MPSPSTAKRRPSFNCCRLFRTTKGNPKHPPQHFTYNLPSGLAILLETSKLWRKLRKRRLKKLRESQDGEEGEGDEKLENSAEKADLLIQEYGVPPDDVRGQCSGEAEITAANEARLRRILTLHAKEIHLLEMHFPNNEVHSR